MRRLRVNPQGWSPSKSENSGDEDQSVPSTKGPSALADDAALTGNDLPVGEGGNLSSANSSKRQSLRDDK